MTQLGLANNDILLPVKPLWYDSFPEVMQTTNWQKHFRTTKTPLSISFTVPERMVSYSTWMSTYRYTYIYTAVQVYELSAWAHDKHHLSYRFVHIGGYHSMPVNVHSVNDLYVERVLSPNQWVHNSSTPRIRLNRFCLTFHLIVGCLGDRRCSTGCLVSNLKSAFNTLLWNTFEPTPVQMCQNALQIRVELNQRVCLPGGSYFELNASNGQLVLSNEVKHQ